ncbi:hypothetical protein SAY87_002213 [Trapa incisa]|uniref:nicotinate phosphoribosyltransferase n=1 Tax=Trapa incisa TaxID=236973 RepID=A0AAN7JWE8_9MYRT|nr:hypothetical protein SAY87_002213 [Trapa incisa]
MKNNSKSNSPSTVPAIPGPTNSMVTPLFTDLYQFTLHTPTGGLGSTRSALCLTYTVFACLDECIRFIANFKLTEFVFLDFGKRSSNPKVKFKGLLIYISWHLLIGFFEYLRGIDCSDIEVHAISEREGPDGGIGASKYCYMGGFDSTSNVAAGKLFGIPLSGRHSHAFSELAAFTSYALAFPNDFPALVNTHDVTRSGVANFCVVALALHELGYTAAGIRLNSGDLAYLSYEAGREEVTISDVLGYRQQVYCCSNFCLMSIQGHEVDTFGIGTYLVTCYAQAALGCLQLVEIKNQPPIKLSEDVSMVIRLNIL